jgi:hypothetical protein
MVTTKVKDYTHLAKAKCSAVGAHEGILYKCPTKGSWFFLHNNAMTGDGGKPDGFESLKEQHGFKRSWHIAYVKSENSSYGIELLDHVEAEFLSGEDIKKCIRMHSSYDGMRIRAHRCGYSGDGIAYFCKDNNKWYFLSDNSDFDGDAPNNWSKVRKEYNITFSWFFANGRDENIDFAHIDSIEVLGSVPAKKENPTPSKPTLHKQVKASMHGYKVLMTHHDRSIEGILYHCHQVEGFFVLHNDESQFGGGTPGSWKDVRSKYGVTKSWNIADSSGTLESSSADHIEILSTTPVEPMLEPAPESKSEPKPEVKCITIDYSSLEAGAKVLFAIAAIGELPEMALPTRGILYEHNSEWYILHNERTKDGSRPPGISSEISSVFDGEYQYSWSISNSKSPYQNLTRFEILSRPVKQVFTGGEANIAIGHKHMEDKFAVGKTITSLTKEQFKTKTGSIEFKHYGGEDNLYGAKATVTKSSEDKTMIGVEWFNGRTYTMDKSEFQEFYNDLGTTLYIRGEPIETTDKVYKAPYGMDEDEDEVTVILGIDGTHKKVSTKSYTDKSIDPLSKSEYIPPMTPDVKCKLTPTRDHEITGDQVPRTKKIDTLLILGL